MQRNQHLKPKVILRLLPAFACVAGVALVAILVLFAQVERSQPLDFATAISLLFMGLGACLLEYERRQAGNVSISLGLVAALSAIIAPDLWTSAVNHWHQTNPTPHGFASDVNAATENVISGLIVYGLVELLLKGRPNLAGSVRRVSGALICGLAAADIVRWMAQATIVGEAGGVSRVSSFVVLISAGALVSLGGVWLRAPIVDLQEYESSSEFRISPYVWPSVLAVSMLLALSLSREDWRRLRSLTQDELNHSISLIESRLDAALIAFAQIGKVIEWSPHLHGADCPVSALDWLPCEDVIKRTATDPEAGVDQFVQGKESAPSRLDGSFVDRDVDRPIARFMLVPEDKTRLFFITPVKGPSNHRVLVLDRLEFSHALLNGLGERFDRDLQWVGNVGPSESVRRPTFRTNAWHSMHLERAGLALSLSVRPHSGLVYDQRSSLPTFIIVGGFLLGVLFSGIMQTMRVATVRAERLRTQNTYLEDTLSRLCVEIDERTKILSLLSGQNDMLKTLQPDTPFIAVSQALDDLCAEVDPTLETVLYLRDSAKGDLHRAVVESRMDDRTLGFFDAPEFMESASPITVAQKSGRPVCSADLRTDSRWTHLQAIARDANIQGLHVIPIQTPAGSNVGAICVSIPSPGILTDRQIRQFELASQLSGEVCDRYWASIQLGQTMAELKRLNREIEDFVFAVSHDLKAPLLTVAGFTGFLKQRTCEVDDTVIQDWAERINSGIDQMRHLVDDLIELGRAGHDAIHAEQVDLLVVVQKAVAQLDSLIQESGAFISVQKNMPTVEADPGRLIQAIQNLVENAIRHGRSRSGQCSVQIAADLRGTDVRLSVRDNGPGIDPVHHATIFKVFERLDHEVDGTGIGLSVVARVAQTHGGQAWVDSALGDGATFYLQIPICRPVSGESKPAAQAGEYS